MAYSLKLYFLHTPPKHLQSIVDNNQYNNFIQLKRKYVTENPNLISRIQYAERYNETCQTLKNIFKNAGILFHVFKPIK